MYTEVVSEQEYGIKDVCRLLDLSMVYVRRMILKGKIQSRKVEIGNNTYKHMILGSEIIRWRTDVGNRSRREDGRSKFTLYSTKEEFVRIQELLKQEDIQSLIQRPNKVKEIG